MKMIIKENVYINDKKNRMVLTVEDQDKKVEYLIFWQKLVQAYEGFFEKGDLLEISGQIDGPKFENTHPCDGQAYTVRSETNISVLQRNKTSFQEEKPKRINYDLIAGPDDNQTKANIEKYNTNKVKELAENESKIASKLSEYEPRVTEMPLPQKYQKKINNSENTKLVGKQNTELTTENIKKFIEPRATDQEIMFFLELCLHQGLNPFQKDAFLVKYGTSPATIIVAKHIFLQRAELQTDFKGFEAGIIVFKKASGLILNDETIERQGSFYTEDEKLVGGWAKIFRENKTPFYESVRVGEYEQKKKDGTLNKFGTEKPATMIRKVALVHALREAYPTVFQGMYDKSEMDL